MDLLSCLISALFLLVVAIAFSEWDKHKKASEIRQSLANLGSGIPDDFYEKIAEDRAVWQEYLKRHGVFPMASIDMEDTPDVMRELDEIRRVIRNGRASPNVAGIKAAVIVDDLNSRDFS